MKSPIDNVTIHLTCDRMGFNVGGKRMDGVRVADVNTKFAFYRRGRSELTTTTTTLLHLDTSIRCVRFLEVQKPKSDLHNTTFVSLL